MQMALGVIKLAERYCQNSFDLKIEAMKNSKSKRLHKRIDTICDFNRGNLFGGTPETTAPETDPTTATMTIVITTVNTHVAPKKLM